MKVIFRKSSLICGVIEKVYPKQEYLRKKFTDLDDLLISFYYQISKKNDTSIKDFENEISVINIFLNHYRLFLSIFDQFFNDIAVRYRPKNIPLQDFVDEIKSDLWLIKKDTLVKNYNPLQSFLPYLTLVLRSLAVDKTKSFIDNHIVLDLEGQLNVGVQPDNLNINVEIIEVVRLQYIHLVSKEMFYFKILNNIQVKKEEVLSIFPRVSTYYLKVIVETVNDKFRDSDQKIVLINKVLKKLYGKALEKDSARRFVNRFISEEAKKYDKLESKDLKKVLIYIFDNN